MVILQFPAVKALLPDWLSGETFRPHRRRQPARLLLFTMGNMLSLDENGNVTMPSHIPLPTLLPDNMDEDSLMVGNMGVDPSIFDPRSHIGAEGKPGTAADPIVVDEDESEPENVSPFHFGMSGGRAGLRNSADLRYRTWR